ncbi:MAG: chorismate mutase [Candidatus Anstonellales archaeon]
MKVLNKAMNKKTLKALRRAINEIDHGIINLIKKRIDIGKKVAKAKIKIGMQIRDRKREKDVIKNAMTLSKKKGIIKTKRDEKMIKALFSWMIKKNIEEQKRYFIKAR